MKTKLIGLTMILTSLGAGASPLLAQGWGGRNDRDRNHTVETRRGDRDRGRYAPPAPPVQSVQVRDRAARRARSVAAIRARWDARFLARADVKAELSLHAERMARLNRMANLARANRYPGLVGRIQALIKRENARHDARMTALRQSGIGYGYGGRG